MTRTTQFLLLSFACSAVSFPQQKAVTQHDVAASGASLPIRRVDLYKNGVGFFQHAGQVRGNQRVTIDFTTTQLNDVLQTLTAIDLGGGHVTGAGYNSTTPLDQQLRTLPLGLSSDPSAEDFYHAVRGARVQVTGSGAPVTGRILNIEVRTPPAVKADENATPATFLTVISDAGAVHTVELNVKTSVRLLDPGLHSDVDRYLQILSDRHTDGLRHLSLTDNGTGTRELRVSYISEVPVWKATYRVLFDNAAGTSGATKQATLQGWAVIDNTTGVDWNNVQLSLVAGAPQSFVQPISQPYYSRRPEIGLPQEAQLTPQTHESGEGEPPPPPPPPGQVAGVAGSGMGSAGGSAGGIMGGLGMGSAPTPVVRNQRSIGNGSGGGLGAGLGGNTGGGTYNINGAQPLSYEDSAVASITANTTTSGFDDFFEYKLTDPVTIAQNRSALVPILQVKVDVDPVTLYSASSNTSLRALWIKNTSTLTLDRGSFTVLQSGNFTGEGLLDTIHPGERRLLSYANDTAVRVTQDRTTDRTVRRVQQVTVSKGILTEKAGEVRENDYVLHNAAGEARNVVVEVPRLRGWDLNSDLKADEITADAYRFRVATAPGATQRLRVAQRHTLFTRYALLSVGEQQISTLLQGEGDFSRVRAALQPLFDAKRKVSELNTQIAQQREAISHIDADQVRLRENLAALKNSSEERALVKRYTGELNAQEDRINTLRDTVTRLQTERDAAQKNLERQVEALTFTADLS